jgi:photosystem II stability/assembly factor-like uncharacterized protein
VHGVGINPRDGALFIATHTGLFRVPGGESKASRVGDRYQDTMGFTVIGPDRFLGSGHPDGRDDLPPFLGLIESRDAGASWKPVSLVGEMDFHVLEARGARVYGFGSDFDTREARFLASADAGKTWEERQVLEPLLSLDLHPDDPDHLVASGERHLYRSPNGGRSWRRLNGDPALVAWVDPERLVVVTLAGAVLADDGTGRRWRRLAEIGGEPAAFEAEDDGLYVALHDGTIKRSSDGGRSWTIRSRP